MRPDYSKFQLKAGGMTDDSVAYALQAAGRLFGREADYETLACLTGNVFAPHVDLKEDCMSHWMVTAFWEMNGMPTAAAYLGLSAQKLPLPEFAGDWRNEEESLAFRRKCAVVIRQALDDGAVVLTEGGWDIKGPKGFVHWGLAGLLTHADPTDGSVRGAHLWGQRDHPIRTPGTATYALRPAGEMRPLAEFHATITRQAVDRIRGRGVYAGGERVVYGLAAMDAWIKMMAEAPGYCAPCFRKVGATAGDAPNNARRVSNGAKVAGKFLRKLGPQYEAAARHYDRIVELLDPVLAGRGGGKYEEFLGDMAKQKAHAETVLKPVRAELLGVADELEEVLTARSREARLRADGFTQDSYCLAMCEAARLLGRPVSYETMLALTSNAFAPGHDTGNDCKELWIGQGWVSHLAPCSELWASVGLAVEPMTFPAPAQRAACVEVIRSCMRQGRIVVVAGGWRAPVEPWWAGIVTAVTPEGTVLGAHPNGRTDNEVESFNTGEAFAVAAVPVTMAREQVVPVVLRNAAMRIRAQGAAGSFGRHQFCCFGMDAMDDWIQQVSSVPAFCPPCQQKTGRGWASAQKVAQACVDRSRAAAWILREYGQEAAAKHYDRIVELLTPVKHQEFIGDLDKQKAYAETVLVPVKSELAAAAGKIEKALSASAPKAPDPSKLARLATHGHHPEDPFSLTLQAVAAAFGREVDYDTVFALSSNCFAPDIRPDEECRSTWRLRGRGQCLDLVADRLGLKVRPLGCLCPKYPQARKGDEVAALVRQALADGEVVITDSGWRHDFMLWGIVTGVRDNGKLTGVTPNGRTDNTFDHLCSFWALSPEPPGLSQREADLATLRQAVARIRADREPFLASSLACGLPATGSPEVAGAVVWGLAAMDRWIEQMKRVPYQQDDAGSSAGNARLCALHTLHGAEVAARQLREMAARLGTEAGPHLEAAAQRYERVAALLRPALTGEGAESYGQIMGNAAKQKAHADTVLTPVKAELHAAARELEKARVSAEDPAPGEVKSAVVARLTAEEQAAVAGRGYAHNSGEGYIYNPIGLGLALTVALRHAGDTVTYEEFAAASGWAFSFGYRYEDRSTSNLDICGRGEPLDPHDVFRVCLEQRGYGLEVARVRDRETFWAFVKRHVDANTPVVSEQLDGGLIYGYREKGGARQVWFDGPVGGPAWVDADKLQPTRVGVLVKRGETPAPEVFLRQELTRVAALASAHDFRGVPQGVAALEAYAADVADPAKSFEKTSEWFCWATFERLGARGFCAPWLRQTAETLGGAARAPLQNAAEHYERATQIYAKYYRETRWGNQDKRPFAERFRTPGRIAELAPVLEQGIAAERLGVAGLQQAVTALGAAKENP